MKKTSLLLLFVSATFFCQAQDRPELITDSTFLDAQQDATLFQEVSNLDPQRAALLSAVLPGLGQVYNKQYWKVPIVITGMVVFGHFINYNNRVYHGLRNAALLNSVNPAENPYSEVISSTEGLVRNRDIFRRNRDFMIVLGSVFYILQIVDAHVSAHLDEFNVNEDLAIGIKPSIQQTPLFSQAAGLSIVLKF